jgi:hypothetical protein
LEKSSWKNQVGKIKLEKSSWKNQVETGFLACKNQFRNFFFADYTGSKIKFKIPRLKIQFLKLDFSKLIFQKSSRDKQEDWLTPTITPFISRLKSRLLKLTFVTYKNANKKWSRVFILKFLKVTFEPKSFFYQSQKHVNSYEQVSKSFERLLLQ